MSIERVKAYFKQYNMEERIIELEESSATVELAAQALGCEPARIAKSLSFMVAEKPVLVICAGDVKVDNGKYKARFGEILKMNKLFGDTGDFRYPEFSFQLQNRRVSNEN